VPEDINDSITEFNLGDFKLLHEYTGFRDKGRDEKL
jgi:hypothetical protein